MTGKHRQHNAENNGPITPTSYRKKRPALSNLPPFASYHGIARPDLGECA
jgi:hypothetical protein